MTGNLLDTTRKLQATLELAEADGISDEHWDRYRSDQKFRERVNEVMLNGGYPIPGALHHHPEDNYFHKAPRPVFKLFEPADWDAQFVILPESVPKFPKWSLNEPCPFWPDKVVYETHFAFLAIGSHQFAGHTTPTPFTIANLLEVMGVFPYWKNRPRVEESRWTKQPDLKESSDARRTTPQPRWYLMPRLPVPLSRDVIPEGYEVAQLSEYFQAVVLYYQKYGSWIGMGGKDLRDYLAICAEATYRRGTGPFDMGMEVNPQTQRLVIHDNWGRLSQIPSGLALSRKLPENGG